MKALKQKFTKIPKGYRITIESCENDADYYSTNITDGLSLEEVKMVVQLCKSMKSQSRNNGCFGNLYSPEYSEKVSLFNKLNEIFNVVPEYTVTEYNLEDVEDEFYNVLSDWGFIGQQDGQFTRYSAGYKIEYLPEDTFIEDVTARFGF